MFSSLAISLVSETGDGEVFSVLQELVCFLNTLVDIIYSNVERRGRGFFRE